MKTMNANEQQNIFSSKQAHNGGTYYQTGKGNESCSHLLQYRSPPRIEATITVPPSHEKSVIFGTKGDSSPLAMATSQYIMQMN
jgi:hypothetical protein